MNYTVVIRGRLDNLNDYIADCRTDPHKGAYTKKQNEKICMIAIQKSMRGIKIQSKVKMLYRWYEKDRRRDPDNISSFGRKVFLDALVTCGVIKNDGWRNIAGFLDEFYVDLDNPRIEVEIQEVGT